MKMNFKSSPSDARSLNWVSSMVGIQTSTSACSDDPINPASRNSSSFFVTSERRERMACHFSSKSPSPSGAGSIKFTTGSGKTGRANLGGELKQDGNKFELKFNEFEIVTLK